MRIDLGKPGLLEFSGPDAVRFLNGQITQDVRKVMGTGFALPACVTDAKGKLQFRVTVTEGETAGTVWVISPDGSAGDLEARLTRYLIADDVEVADRSGEFRLWHCEGQGDAPGAWRKSDRLFPGGFDYLGNEDLGKTMPQEEAEIFRITNGIPKWGAEITEGMLPPEAGLDATDISYSKGCYIGQEVISRIKSAGKVNRKLSAFVFADGQGKTGNLINAEGKTCGTVASAAAGRGLGFLKRGMEAEPMSLDGIAVSPQPIPGKDG